jgi:hypothetical protein
VPIPFSKKKNCHLSGEYFFQKESKFVTEYFVFRKLCHLLAILHPETRLISTERRSPLSSFVNQSTAALFFTKSSLI